MLEVKAMWSDFWEVHEADYEEAILAKQEGYWDD